CELFDRLHYLESVYPAVAEVADRFPEGNTASLLRQYLHPLRTEVERVRRLAAVSMPTHDLEADWIDSYAQAIDDLHRGLEAGEKPTVARAVALLRTVPSEKFRVNQFLTVVLAEVPLEALVAGLRGLDERLAALDDGAARGLRARRTDLERIQQQ